MNTFLKLIAGSKNRRISFIFLAISCLSIIAAFIIGISDNRPALFLCYVAAAALGLAFVHTWRREMYFLLARVLLPMASTFLVKLKAPVLPQ